MKKLNFNFLNFDGNLSREINQFFNKSKYKLFPIKAQWILQLYYHYNKSIFPPFSHKQHNVHNEQIFLNEQWPLIKKLIKKCKLDFKEEK